MYLPLLRPIGSADFFVSGDVVIDECAAIAPGVILQADAGCRMTIAAGACVGMGAILHAHKGNLEVAAGAIIGAGVLVVGTSKIGANACIGACSTILSSDIEQEQVVPAGSVFGDSSRHKVVTPETPTDTPVAGPKDSVEQSNPDVSETPANTPESTDPTPDADASDTTEAAAEVPAQPQTPTHGQRQLNRLMLTLFPHGQSLNRNVQNGPSTDGT
ncbi:carbon dioxide concentrating mechanism protein [Microcoleus sp. FACHB-672]|uniref:carbon dioxide concentrating mechanism protein n=1 Tax=Microcoleus sp. FACHB-672 TaxID=2692825 RepID=UPI001684E9DE|nr:carbon dioxide concentrating mechanism protein [Microcoleus sp. FACHB-672]MBD2042426.1 carbon dioxide concentrating mechanism protein [Microcoleus sp. FACHB-672]